MARELKHAVLFTTVTMLLFGGGYHGVLWIIGRVAFPSQAEGSLIRAADGAVLGSRLVAQAFTHRAYFRPRPSGVDYDAAAAGGTNYGPSNPNHLQLVRRRLDEILREDAVAPGQVPSELITASGSGLDPHLPPAAAELQAARVARARSVPVERVRDVVRAHTEPPVWGLVGPARVNVLELNIALDQAFGPPPAE